MIGMATTNSEYPQISIEVSILQSILNNISGRSYVVLQDNGERGKEGGEGRKWGKQWNIKDDCLRMKNYAKQWKSRNIKYFVFLCSHNIFEIIYLYLLSLNWWF